MTPFEMRWEAGALDALRARIRAFRFEAPPSVPPADPWADGCDPAFLRALCGYWTDGFDFDAALASLNRFPQFRHAVDGTELHAIHVVGEAGGRRPLLLVHGWPGSVVEFLDVAERLAFPSRNGGRAEDAFDLVIPSLPGFGASGPPAGPIGARGTASLLARLMRDGFGYDRFLVQGGDWGSAVAAWLALEHAEAVRSIHLNYLLVQPDAEPRTEAERAFLAAGEAAQRALGGYSHLQQTRPGSLDYAMRDNPVAQAAWILERFHDWSDLRDRSFEAAFDRDTLLTNIMLYATGDGFAHGARYYKASAREGVRRMPPGRRVSVPTAFAAYHDPRTPRPPRSWVERGYDVVRWTEPARGGHFAALEAPDLFVDDLRGWGRAVADRG